MGRTKRQRSLTGTGTATEDRDGEREKEAEAEGERVAQGGSGRQPPIQSPSSYRCGFSHKGDPFLGTIFSLLVLISLS
uniref:Uncharacterized protein n=1 Tax=Oryza meridionalis TaxID=40149 RepID=A0A0E0F520_9ORYZ